MPRALRRLARSSLLALATVSLAASAVLAASPTRVIEEVHISNTFPAGVRCPFEVVRTVDGTLVTTTFTDSRRPHDGHQQLPQRQDPLPESRQRQDAHGGPRGSGRDDRQRRRHLDRAHSRERPAYTAPGIGFIVGNTGLLIATIDTATGEVLSIDFTAGHQDGTTFPALCVGLV